MTQIVKYPVGIQTFKNIINDGYVYVDKTHYVYNLARSGKFFFLSRPRRFGKSLLLSTFESYFRGDRDLFKGLALEKLEKDWIQYPVLRFDLSGIYAKSTKAVEDYIKGLLSTFAETYAVELKSYDNNIGPLFGALITKISAKTGKKVVILIDEYDKGIVDVLDNSSQLQENEDILRPFFSQLKIQEEHIHFCFITGVARFRHFTLFSGVNNIEDLSLSTDYASLCGITETELTTQLYDGIESLAKEEDIVFKEALERLRYNYDGYRFSRSDIKVFNPFSLMLCLKNRCFENYWLSSGTSKVFVTYLGKSNFQLSELEDLWVSKERMEGIYSSEDPIPLMFQTGYFSIKDYNPISRFYKLGIPNGEVRRALVQDLLPKYMDMKSEKVVILAAEMLSKLSNGDISGFLEIIKGLISSVAYHLFENEKSHDHNSDDVDIKKHEKTYHLIFFCISQMLGIDSQCEIAMSGGRIDMLIETTKYVYVLVFKIDGSPAEALAQIEDRGYALPWAFDERKLIKVGVNFSSTKHTIDQWIINE